VWSSEGYVPGPTTDMYSGLAEVYGLYTVLSFLQQYNLTYPLILLQPHNINVHCDNSGIIEWLQMLSSPSYPQDTSWDDYPIFAKI